MISLYRFFTKEEASEFLDKWREFKTMKELSEFARLPPKTTRRLRHYSENNGMEVSEYIMYESSIYLDKVRDLLRKKEMAFGIKWHPHLSVCTDVHVDRMELAFFELAKVSDRPRGPDPEKYDEYFILLRRYWPASKTRVQCIVYESRPPARMDAWFDGMYY